MSISSSLQPNPGLVDWQLRVWFVFYLNKSQTFKHSIEGPRLAWEALVNDRPALSDIADFRDLPLSGDHADPLNQYALSVRTAVINDLRCSTDGGAPSWVCQAVHGACNGTALDQPQVMDHTLWVGDLRVVVATVGWAAVQPRINDRGLNKGHEIEGDHMAPFRLWKQLRKAAHEHLDTMLEAIRSDQDNVTSDWQRMYRKGFTTKTQATMQKLVAWLVDREVQFGGDRSATNDLLHDLQLDPPGVSKKFDQ